METRKIALACFIGGAVCAAVALLLAPDFWWLGLLAGFCAGYLSYEFRSVLRAVPKAWNDARDEVVTTCQNYKTKIIDTAPFTVPALILGALASIAGEYYFVTEMVLTAPIGAAEVFLTSIGTVVILVAGYSVAMVFRALIATPAFFGARYSEDCYWWPFLIEPMYVDGVVARLHEDGLRRMPITVSNSIRWTIKGCGLILLFFVWTIWKYLAIALGKVVYFLYLFARLFLRIIHSDKRLLCGVDGALGGYASYLWFAPTAETLAAKAMVVLFGGLLGAVFGIANWEIVSKRIFRIPARDQT